MAVFDTFALVKFVRKEIGYEKVAAALEEGGIISEGTLYEFLHVCTKDFLEQNYELHESLRKATEIVESLLLHLEKQNITLEIAKEAVYFKRHYHKLNLSNFDCLALAMAKVLNEPLLSGEKGLIQVKEVKVMG